MPIRSFKQLLYEATWLGPKKIAVAAAANADVLLAAFEAHQMGMAQCILIDDQTRLADVARDAGLDLSTMTVIHADDETQATVEAVRMAGTGAADVVMKGRVNTTVFMKAVLDRELGLRAGKLFTHIAVYEIPGMDRLLLISDGGVIIAPDIYQKIEIVQNAIDIAQKLGIEEPKVAILAAAELVNPKIQSTVDAANLSKMAERGQIHGGIVDGPLGLDNAISLKAAEIKGIHSPVAGQADILIVPDIEAGNIMAKAITYFAHAEMAGVVAGGTAPIVLTSRSDSHETKLVSMALAIIAASTGYRQVKFRPDA